MRLRGLRVVVLGVFCAVACGGLVEGGVAWAGVGHPYLSQLSGFTTPAGVPSIDEESVGDVTSSAATLQAQINPLGHGSTYRFEYGTSTAYGTSVPVPAGELPAVLGDQEVSQHIQGLQPSTLYHYRVSASDSFGTEPGVDQTFTTPTATPVSGLPDGRAYELVSTNNKEGGNVYPVGEFGIIGSSSLHDEPSQVSADGDSVSYYGDPGVGGSGRTGDVYLASRRSGGWSAGNIMPPFGTYPPPDYGVFSSDLSAAIVFESSPRLSEAAPLGYEDLYRRDDATGTYEPLITSVPPNRSAEEFSVRFEGASSDLSHVIFSANDALVHPAVDGGAGANNLYEWSNGALRLVNVYPDGSTAPGAAFVWAEPGYQNLVTGGGLYRLQDAISSDGARIFWTGADGNLYARENGTVTVPIPGGHFDVASSDGSTVIVDDGSTLSEYNVSDRRLTAITPSGSGIDRVFGISSNGSYVYFVADAALAPGATPGDCTKGINTEELSVLGCNLYVRHDNVTTFIAKLTVHDLRSDYRGVFGNISDTVAQVTPDGATIEFKSERSLTGYDNVDPSGECKGACDELYVYHAGTGQLFCASCNSSGAAPLGGAVIPADGIRNYEEIAGAPVGGVSPHLLSDDGTRLFFDSRDALVPGDTNETWDAYEYEQDGAGTCRLSAGCIYLISSGQSDGESMVSTATPSGDDVFFVTQQALVAQDQDFEEDLYDARVGGGFPVPAVEAECAGEGCKAPPSSPPGFGVLASTTVSGAGNIAGGSGAKPVVKPKKKAAKKRHRVRSRKHKGATGKTRKAKKTVKGRK
jgi:hypothetical protein